MLCIKWIRKNPEALDAMLHSRGMPKQGDVILAQDASYRTALKTLEELQHTSNMIAKSQAPLEERRQKAKDIKAEIIHMTQQVGELKEALEATLLLIPNMLLEDVPFDPSGKANALVHERGKRRTFSFAPKHHADFTHLGFSDISGAQISGSRFSVLRGPLAVLENAVRRFLLDHNMQRGYELVSTPVLVREATLVNTGQLPKFAHDLFKTQTDHWLIPTAEVPVTSLVAQQTLEEASLPLRFVAITECFRREAGAAGRHTRGLIRQHQFTKVELVHIATSAQGLEELEILTENSESILDALQIPYRRMTLCSGDTGFSAAKTYDLEVWMPGMNEYCEIASCSLCTTFQAQRMEAYYRTQEGKRSHVATLNGTGLAVGRTLATIIENYQREDGNIDVPEVLRPYLNKAVISPV